MHILLPTSAIIIAYLCGSLSAAILVCRCMRLPDPRTTGSNNPGATNVMRIGGTKAAILTLFGDFAKGWLPVAFARLLGAPDILLGGIAIAAFVGHLYPLFFRFQGGKGVATAFGALTGIAWPIGACIAITWGIVAALFRYSSLAALVTALLAPIYVAHFASLPLAGITLLMSALLIYRHRSNINKLRQGTENKLGKRRG